ncbi:hypothetical protein PanWU01x14_238980 [Parasponia andersonii]|uniref:Uncharacterized protein n=1 Tax=Parasponia andersonii TaxID=3476 RepID=A0A2P5BHH2_PARAD|nr:hypothetical protein PanWU01x14_238980 [Parasponia andersonii]
MKLTRESSAFAESLLERYKRLSLIRRESLFSWSYAAVEWEFLLLQIHRSILIVLPTSMLQLIEHWKRYNYNFLLLITLINSKAARHLGITDRDSEFRVAFEEVVQHGGTVFLGDRPIEISYERMWRKMTLWEKFKTPFSECSINLLRRKHIALARTSREMPIW